MRGCGVYRRMGAGPKCALRKVALVDDHPLMVDALVQLLSQSKKFEIAAIGTTAVDIIELAADRRPDAFIVDLHLSGNVYEAIARALQVSPQTKFVAFTASTTVESAIRALDAGAKGYVLKGSSANELISALEHVLRGETYITQSFATRVISALRNTSQRRTAAEVNFSIREEQIVRLLLRGKTNREIALTLNISVKTVKHYMTVLMQKLHVRNRIEVVLAAQKLGERDEAISISGQLAH